MIYKGRVYIDNTTLKMVASCAGETLVHGVLGYSNQEVSAPLRAGTAGHLGAQTFFSLMNKDRAEAVEEGCIRFNNSYKEKMEERGFQVTGTLKEDNLCEIAEIEGHPWMLGVQFHPEFKSKPTDPHPLFRDFIKAMIAHKK